MGENTQAEARDRGKDRVETIAAERANAETDRERERERERTIGIKGQRDARTRWIRTYVHETVYDASGQLLPIYTRIAAAIKFYGRASRERETPVSNALSASRKAGRGDRGATRRLFIPFPFYSAARMGRIRCAGN